MAAAAIFREKGFAAANGDDIAKAKMDNVLRCITTMAEQEYLDYGGAKRSLGNGNLDG